MFSVETTVTIPRKEGVSVQDAPVQIWPLVEAALTTIGADLVTREAALKALETSDGCVILANYLNSEAKRVHKMDYRFKVPLIVLASNLTQEDNRTDVFYDPQEGAIYFETDTNQYSFHVFKDWTVDWAEIADEVIPGYEWSGEENQTWALDRLLSVLDETVEGDLGA